MASLRSLQSAISKFRHLVSECRRATRRPSDEPLKISWCDAGGRVTEGNGRCVDISDHGARVAYFEPIRLPAIMQVRFERIGVVQAGRVVHCTRKGDHYEYGIAFCAPEELRRLFKTSPASSKTRLEKFPRLVGGAPLDL